MPTKATFRWAVAVNIIVAAIAVAFWVCDSAQTGTAIIQTLILGDTLWVLWLYTRATFTLATTAEDQMKFVKAQFIDTKVGELIRSKPIVVTDRGANGETLISNVGDAFATNVWYLADAGQEPVALGSLGQGQTRVVQIEVADRHVLIAEARQMPPGIARLTGRRLSAPTPGLRSPARDRGANGETLISNVGDAFATNVWYLADAGQEPVALGSLGQGQTRVVQIEVADRHVLIAEARQMPPGIARLTGRRLSAPTPGLRSPARPREGLLMMAMPHRRETTWRTLDGPTSARPLASARSSLAFAVLSL